MRSRLSSSDFAWEWRSHLDFAGGDDERSEENRSTQAGATAEVAPHHRHVRQYRIWTVPVHSGRALFDALYFPAIVPIPVRLREAVGGSGERACGISGSTAGNGGSHEFSANPRSENGENCRGCISAGRSRSQAGERRIAMFY